MVHGLIPQCKFHVLLYIVDKVIDHMDLIDLMDRCMMYHLKLNVIDIENDQIDIQLSMMTMIPID